MRLVLAAVPLITILLPVAAAQAQAPGSYRGSCTDISQNGSTLTARCRGSNGRLNDTAINLDECHGQPVANSFGRLSCGNVRGSSEPTPGGGQGYDRPPRPDDGDAYGVPRRRYRAPPPAYGYDAPPPPPPSYDRQPDPDEAYAAPPRPRPRRFDPDQDY